MLTISEPALRQQLLPLFSEARRETDRLFAIIRPEALYDRPIPERHRIFFYIGHLEAFDWNLLREHLRIESFHPEFDRLFAFGIDPVDGGLPSDTPDDWPSLHELQKYREQIRSKLNSALAEAPSDDALTQLMNIAIEHRLMHAETLEYMFHQLPFDRKIKPVITPEASGGRLALEALTVPAGRATLGLKRDAGFFGWDNEFDAHIVDVPAFSIDRYKVTNGQFVEFLDAGGYSERGLWSDADWAWRSEARVSSPVFWAPSAKGWNYRTMFDEIPLPMDAPVFVSHAEARAYACWAGKTLPSEAQWHRAAYGTADGSERDYPWGRELPQNARSRWEPPPMGMSPQLKSAFGVEDLIGTGWEWTSTQFAPFPGFRIVAAYPGYSANFFDGMHYVMKGGSTRTAVCMLRRSFRNWFQPHYQYVYAGFRCVKD